jgi:tRNA U34 2-thiouridine synthase MnmA/TrmU
LTKKAKCILLYSGGLDSLLAGKILLDLNIEVIGLHCLLPYYPPDTDLEKLDLSINAKHIGLSLIHHRCGPDYIDILKNPPNGYGKNINPCIDCKIYFIKKAAEMMMNTNADFVATGEVVGQRPMSQQKNTLNLIENSTLKGRLLRPLSAKLLKPTIPETTGLVDRDKLYDINGRGRSGQLELAEKFGLANFAQPSGGCLFTDKFIAARVKDLIVNDPEFKQEELYLLKIGRHFRINPSLKIVVSRNKEDTLQLEKYEDNSDFFFRPDFSGPSVYAKGAMNENDIDVINSIISRYGKPSATENIINIYKNKNFYKAINSIDPIDDKELENYRII